MSKLDSPIRDLTEGQIRVYELDEQVGKQRETE
jgi:hypothetical protein